MAELPDVPSLRMLEPPSGGLEALREKLETPAPAPLRWWIPIAAVAVTAVIAIIVLSARTRTAPRATSTSTTPMAIRDRSIGDTFYWVASAPRLERHERNAVISIDDAPSVQAYAPP